MGSVSLQPVVIFYKCRRPHLVVAVLRVTVPPHSGDIFHHSCCFFRGALSRNGPLFSRLRAGTLVAAPTQTIKNLKAVDFLRSGQAPSERTTHRWRSSAAAIVSQCAHAFFCLCLVIFTSCTTGNIPRLHWLHLVCQSHACVDDLHDLQIAMSFTSYEHNMHHTQSP